MTLRELQYLVALADHGGFRRAAEACLVSQPTLSAQVRKLEEELGVALFERTSRKLLMTPAGRDAVERARRILSEVQQMKQAAEVARAVETGTIRLGVFPTLGPYFLPHVVPLIRTRFPRLELLLFEERTDALISGLNGGTLDAAFLALPVNDAHLQCEFLFEEPFLLAVPGTDPLAHRRKLPIAELANHNLMLLEEGHCLRDQALEVCRLSGTRERSEFRATSLETLRQMVAAGVGMTLLPVLATRNRVSENENIRLLEFSDSHPSRKIGLVWRKTSALSQLFREIAALCRGLPESLLAPCTDG